jgi:hypothetical protein
MKNIKLAAFTIGFILVPMANATDLYNNIADTTGISYYGCWDGGSADAGGGTSYGLQTGQVFTSSITGTLTSAEGIYENLSSAPALTGALVQVFNFSSGSVGSLVGEQFVSGSITNMGQSRHFSNFFENRVAALVSIPGLVSGQKYLAVLQPQGNNWGWLEDNNNGNKNTFCRDYSNRGSSPSFGNSIWKESGTYSGFFSGDTVMRIQGEQLVPEPCSLVALSVGALAFLRRRRATKSLSQGATI